MVSPISASLVNSALTASGLVSDCRRKNQLLIQINQKGTKMFNTIGTYYI